MKKFLITTGVFSIGFIILNLSLYLLVFNSLIYRDYIVSKKTLEKYRYFLFSDSHGLAIKQSNFKDSGIYNFSFGSDSYIDIYFKLKYLFDREIKPEAVIVTVDDHTLSNYRNTLNNKNRSIHYADYESFSKYYPSNYLFYLYQKFAFRYIPMLNPNNSSLFNRFLLTELGIKKKKSEMRKKNWKDNKRKIENCKSRIKYQFPDDEASVEMTNCLIDIIMLCKNNNIPLYGVKFPLTKSYIEILGDKSYHADLVFRSNDITVFDYRDVYTDYDEYFINQDHLNEVGARKLAEVFKTDLENKRFSDVSLSP